MNKRAAARILRTAANLIAKGGLVKGKFKEGRSYCALGAMGFNWECSGNDNQRLARNALCKVVGVTAIPAWNDKLERTKTEVISTMRRAARLLEHGLKVTV